MKRIAKGPEPESLARYRRTRPDSNWQQFKKSDKERLRELRNRIHDEQGGLCAYCEIDLIPLKSRGAADSRVEHFHPKSDKKGGKNWNLEWRNLLGCCHGGSRPNVADAKSRYTSPDHSCDVPKGDRNLDSRILNPLNIPAFPALFDFTRQGVMSVNVENCQAAGIKKGLAEGSISHLRLNAQRLKRMRSAELNEINQTIADMVAAGVPIEGAREKMAKALLRKDKQGNWPKFFSAIRAYLGSAAEKQLEGIGYGG